MLAGSEAPVVGVDVPAAAKATELGTPARCRRWRTDGGSWSWRSDAGRGADEPEGDEERASSKRQTVEAAADMGGGGGPVVAENTNINMNIST